MTAEQGHAGESRSSLRLVPLATFPGMRALAWKNDVLYASRGYELLKARVVPEEIEWELVGRWQP